MNKTTMEQISDRELSITRTFNAPPRIVFDAWTRADLVKRWWAPKSLGVVMASCEADIRVGGAYRYVLRNNGEDIAFSGKYTEITPHSRLVYTHYFEPMFDAGAVIVTVTFIERDGKTVLTSRELYPSKEVLEGALASGMEAGMRDTFDQLDALVASLG
ncbi:SRPBCC family protein [Pendulispora albinea]|uniref:SRPBCC family protein n=1 Tax=Pendulispora albinea TaxID=2741071 RepID=A0ABZ2LME8_9BACT